MTTAIAPWTVPALGPSGHPSPSCAAKSDICTVVFDLTRQVWLAESSYWLLVKPLRILMFVVLALVARYLVHRTINRVVRHTIEASNGRLLGGLRERISPALRAASVLPSERRRQRTEALGSVLRSVASATVFAITVMLVLAELGVNLGPILASAGIVGIAVGLGAQNMVRDFLAGMFILVEDQFGVGDMVDLGQAGVVVAGTVEAVGLRITTLRDERGVLWYIRNGEIMRVGNKSQGWSLVVVDVQVGFGSVARTTAVLKQTVAELAADPRRAGDLLAPPEVLGIEEIVTDATVLRITAKTPPDARFRVGRVLRRRIADALADAGLDATADAATTAEPGAAAEPSVMAESADVERTKVDGPRPEIAKPRPPAP